MSPKRAKHNTSKEQLTASQSDPNTVAEILKRAQLRAKEVVGKTPRVPEPKTSTEEKNGKVSQKLIPLPPAPPRKRNGAEDGEEACPATEAPVNPGGKSSGSTEKRCVGKTPGPKRQKVEGALSEGKVASHTPTSGPSAVPSPAPTPTSVAASPAESLVVTPSPRQVEKPHTSATKESPPHESQQESPPQEPRKSLDFDKEEPEKPAWDWDKEGTWWQNPWEYMSWKGDWSQGWNSWEYWKGYGDHGDAASQWGDGTSEFSEDETHDEERKKVLDALNNRKPTQSDLGSEAPEPVPTPAGEDAHVSDLTDDPSPTKSPDDKEFEVDQASQAEGSPGEVDTSQQGGDGGNVSPEQEPWRCDKNGEPLSPAALYMRFYRNIRSTLLALVCSLSKQCICLYNLAKLLRLQLSSVFFIIIIITTNNINMLCVHGSGPHHCWGKKNPVPEEVATKMIEANGSHLAAFNR